MLYFIAEKCDGETVEENNEKPNKEPNLYLYDDDLETRPHISTFISSLANYENTIPAATDPDAKAPAPSARMGKSLHLQPKTNRATSSATPPLRRDTIIT